jgi:hypothetical protein
MLTAIMQPMFGIVKIATFVLPLLNQKISAIQGALMQVIGAPIACI